MKFKIYTKTLKHYINLTYKYIMAKKYCRVCGSYDNIFKDFCTNCENFIDTGEIYKDAYKVYSKFNKKLINIIDSKCFFDKYDMNKFGAKPFVDGEVRYVITFHEFDPTDYNNILNLNLKPITNLKGYKRISIRTHELEIFFDIFEFIDSNLGKSLSNIKKFSL